MAVFIALLVVPVTPLHASSCHPSNEPYAGANIGFQYVANGCTSQGRTIYSRYDLNCLNGTVQAIDQQAGAVSDRPALEDLVGPPPQIGDALDVAPHKSSRAATAEYGQPKRPSPVVAGGPAARRRIAGFSGSLE